MLHPDDIEGREFFVGLRGYDREEVDGFLAELAAEHRALLEEIEELRNREPERIEVPVERDPFEDLGANVTAILRTANDSAASIRAEAEQYAERARNEIDDEIAQRRDEADRQGEAVRLEAEAYAQRVRGEADETVLALQAEAETYAEQVRREAEAEAMAERGRAEADVVRARAQADELRAEADHVVAEARRQAESLVADARSQAEQLHLDAEQALAAGRAEADRLVTEAQAEAARLVTEAGAEQDRLLAEAEGHIAELEAEAERRGRERAVAAADDVVTRLSEATRRHEDLRHRLAEANDEIQLALLALGEPIIDAGQAISDAVREVIDLEAVSGEGEVVNAEH